MTSYFEGFVLALLAITIACVVSVVQYTDYKKEELATRVCLNYATKHPVVVFKDGGGTLHCDLRVEAKYETTEP